MPKKISASTRRLQSQINDLRSHLAAIDLVCPGTLLKRTKVCGKPNCRCAKNPKDRHGPYFEWSRWENGRLVHSVLPPHQAELVATGDAENLHDAVIAMAEADIALQVAMRVTQKAIAAYQEISRMQI